jgi:hypothetical protein
MEICPGAIMRRHGRKILSFQELYISWNLMEVDSKLTASVHLLAKIFASSILGSKAFDQFLL